MSARSVMVTTPADANLRDYDELPDYLSGYRPVNARDEGIGDNRLARIQKLLAARMDAWTVIIAAAFLIALT